MVYDPTRWPGSLISRRPLPIWSLVDIGTTHPSDAERERMATELRSAVAGGILSLEEFEARLDRVYEARSMDELEQLVRWLPRPAPLAGPGAPAPVPARPAHTRFFAAFGAVAVAALLAASAFVGVRTITGMGASGQPQPTVGGLERLVNSCSLIAAEDVSHVLGAAITPQRSFVNERADQCLWSAGADGPAATVQLGSDLADFRSYYRTTDGDIRGLGEQAAVDSSVPGLVLVRTRDVWFEVRVHRTSDDRAAALTIAEQLLTRLESP